MKKIFQIVFVFIISASLFACGLPANHFSKGHKPNHYNGKWDEYYERNAGKGDKKIYPNELQRATIIDSFNIIPDKIGLIDVVVDSSVLSSICYKFIYSPDSTKIIAFYLTPFESREHELMTRKVDEVMYNDHEQKDGQIKFYGKIVWGMKYENKWFYDDDIAHVFFDNSLKDAQTDFLFYSLQVEWFFDKWLTPEYSFWERGGVSVKYLPIRIENYLSVWPAFEGYPILVAEGMGHVRRNNSKKVELWVRQNLDLIRKVDTIGFTEMHIDYLEGYGVDLFDKSGDRAMVSLIRKDTSSNYFISFLYFKLHNDSIESITLLNRNIRTSTAKDFKIYMSAKTTFYQQFLPDYSYMNSITKDEFFWVNELPKMLGQSLLIE